MTISSKYQYCNGQIVPGMTIVMILSNSMINVIILQIGVTNALSLPGAAKEEFFFPIEPKGAKGQGCKTWDFKTSIKMA